MTTLQALPRTDVPLLTMRWLARGASVVSIGLLAMMAFGEPGVPTLREAAALALFPVGVATGMIWAWWNELRGGVLAVLSLVAFYGVMLLLRGEIPGGPYFLLFTSPAFLFVLCGLRARLRGRV